MTINTGDSEAGAGTRFDGRPVFVFSTPPTPNGDLHLGHLSGPYLGADVFVRFQRMNGATAWHLTGSDDFQSYTAARARADGATARTDRRALQRRDPRHAAADGHRARPVHGDQHRSAVPGRAAGVLLPAGRFRVGGPPGGTGAGRRGDRRLPVRGRRVRRLPALRRAAPAATSARSAASPTPAPTSWHRGRPSRRHCPARARSPGTRSRCTSSGTWSRRTTGPDAPGAAEGARRAALRPGPHGRGRHPPVDVGRPRRTPRNTDTDGQVIWVWPEMAYGFLHGIEALGAPSQHRVAGRRPPARVEDRPLLRVRQQLLPQRALPGALPAGVPAAGRRTSTTCSTSSTCSTARSSPPAAAMRSGARRSSARTASTRSGSTCPGPAPRAAARTSERDAYEATLRETLVGTWQRWLNDLGARVAERHGGLAPAPGAWTPEHRAFLRRLEIRRSAVAESLGPDGFSLNQAADELDGIVTDAVRFSRDAGAVATIGDWTDEADTATALELAAARLLALCAAPVMPRFAAQPGGRARRATADRLAGRGHAGPARLPDRPGPPGLLRRAAARRRRSGLPAAAALAARGGAHDAATAGRRDGRRAATRRAGHGVAACRGAAVPDPGGDRGRRLDRRPVRRARRRRAGRDPGRARHRATGPGRGCLDESPAGPEGDRGSGSADFSCRGRSAAAGPTGADGPRPDRAHQGEQGGADQPSQRR